MQNNNVAYNAKSIEMQGKVKRNRWNLTNNKEKALTAKENVFENSKQNTKNVPLFNI